MVVERPPEWKSCLDGDCDQLGSATDQFNLGLHPFCCRVQDGDGMMSKVGRSDAGDVNDELGLFSLQIVSDSPTVNLRNESTLMSSRSGTEAFYSQGIRFAGEILL